jgi:phosphatidylinositol 4-kinase
LFQETPELKLPNTQLTLKVPDCSDTRRKMTQDFVNASSVTLREALRQAPKATKSHLHEYIRKKEAAHEEISSHTQQVLG